MFSAEGKAGCSNIRSRGRFPEGTSEPGKAQVGTDGMTTSGPVPIEAYVITEGMRKRT